MGRKGIKKQFWMSKEQAKDLADKAAKACMPESQLIRFLIAGYHPPEAPGEEFHEDMNRVIEAAEKLQTASERVGDPKAKDALREASMDLKHLTLEIRRRYLTGEREMIRWR